MLSDERPVWRPSSVKFVSNFAHYFVQKAEDFKRYIEQTMVILKKDAILILNADP